MSKLNKTNKNVVFKIILFWSRHSRHLKILFPHKFGFTVLLIVLST